MEDRDAVRLEADLISQGSHFLFWLFAAASRQRSHVTQIVCISNLPRCIVIPVGPVDVPTGGQMSSPQECHLKHHPVPTKRAVFPAAMAIPQGACASEKAAAKDD